MTDVRLGAGMFGRIIVAYRQRLGLTQEELARKTGLNVRSLRELEAGRVQAPRKSSVWLLADAFGLTGMERDRFCAAAPQHGNDRPAGWMTPAQLPADIAFFTGRAGDLDHLDALLVDSTQRVVAAISGTAGVGKTTLAVHWAHRMADRYPGGQLYVNLRGFDSSGLVMAPADALRTLIRALEVEPERMPSDLDALVGLYRTLTTGRRVLIVLDNARDAEQVRMLLPGAGAAAVVVTSRNRLAGLVATDGAHPVNLDLFSVTEARELLARRLGADRVAAEPDAVDDLIAACDRLPLALAIVAARAQHTGFSLADVASELRTPGRRLDALDAGDAMSQVRTVLSWSYAVLTAPARRLFGLLGMHPGAVIDPAAAARLANLPILDAQRLLTELIHANLLVEPTAGRYTFHDLVRAYAAECATEEDPPHRRREALTRLFDHYLATAAAAMDLIYPAEAHSRIEVAPPVVPTPGLASTDAARAWLDAERPTLVAVARYAATNGWPTYAMHLAGTLFRYLDGGYHCDAMTIHGHALRAARSAGDIAGQCLAASHLGAAYAQTGDFRRALEHFKASIRLNRKTDDRAAEARLLGNLGVVEQRLGLLGSAVAHHRQALALASAYGSPSEVARMLSNLGLVEIQLHRYGQAAEHLHQALSLARQHSDDRGQAWASLNLAEAEIGLGRYDDVDRHLNRGLAIFRQQGNRTGEAWALDSLGAFRRQLDQPDEAAAHHQHALTLFRDMGDRDGESWALNALGEVAHGAGNFRQAIDHHEAALAITTATGARDQQARAHAGLGHAHRALGNVADARRHYQDALTGYTALGTPETHQVRACLDSLVNKTP